MEGKGATSKKSATVGQDLSKLQDSCRICMAQNVNMSSIYGTKRYNIVDELEFCTGITFQSNDGLPSKICNPCLKNLGVAYKFKSTCLSTDETFRKLLVKSMIKTEATDVSDNDYLPSEYEDLPDIKEDIKKENQMEHDSIQDTGNPVATVEPDVKKVKLRKLYCKLCDLSFSNKKESLQHKRKMHKETGTWICEICGKIFIHRSSHYAHLKSHEPPQYRCDKCDYDTWHKHDLVKHLRIHAGTKLYQCEFCTKSYYTTSNLLGHIRRNHLNERRFECKMCGKKFYDRTKLNRHTDSHNEIKRFECDICHSRFTRRCYWKKHLFRQHDIITPPERPGRRKTNLLINQPFKLGKNDQLGRIDQLGQIGQLNQISQIGQKIEGHQKNITNKEVIK